jgi:hypothetical protein
MSNPEEECFIQTPLTEAFQRLKELAVESRLLDPMDIEALEKLAALNYIQKLADHRSGPDPLILRKVFQRLYNWLHIFNKYFIHRDEETKLWRLGIELSKRRGG